jgi:hypothetical protein
MTDVNTPATAPNTDGTTGITSADMVETIGITVIGDRRVGAKNWSDGVLE